MTRVFIIHGWDGYPGEGWQGWLAKELESRGDKVYLPAMPNAEWPTIESWVPFLAKHVGKVDAQTALVGHSIGCQTILRYLETLPADTHVGPVVLVAPWVTLNQQALTETKDSMAIAQPWLDAPINWEKIQPMSESWSAIMAADDPWVPIQDSETFQAKLGAKILRTDGRGHMSAGSGANVLPEALNIFDTVWT